MIDMVGNAQMWVVVLAGLAAAITCLGMSVRAGRLRPAHMWAWILGLVLLGIGEAFRLMVAVGTLVQGTLADAWPFVGAAAVGCIIAAAVVRPRLAAWFLLGTALVLPLVLVPGLLGWGGLIPASVTPLHVLGFYGLPALATSGLMFAASWPVGTHAHRLYSAHWSPDRDLRHVR